jgi:hypothetical protein
LTIGVYRSKIIFFSVFSAAMCWEMGFPGESLSLPAIEWKS